MSLANELRIGNWVEILGDSKRLNFFTTIQPSSFSVNIDKTYGAIPLDEDWLLKFGFSEIEHQFLLELKTGNSLSFDFNTGMYLVKEDNELELCEIEINYVHQLQNLYFALAGTELQFQNDQPNL
jgi:hypothetical protein